MSKKHSTHHARWTLMTITLIMNAALVITSVAGYFEAQKSATQTARAVGEAMIFAVKRDLWRSPETPQTVLKWALEEMEPQGLSYVGIHDPKGIGHIFAGSPTVPVEALTAQGFRGSPKFETLQPWSARVVVPMGQRPGRGYGGRHNRANREKQMRRQMIVIDVSPESARLMVSRSTWTLATSLTAAVILLVMAIVFWRLSRRSDKITEQLAKDEHLKSLGRVSAVLGHELRNPIASLKGHAQLLAKKVPEDHRAKRSAQTVLREAVRLEELTDQVLDFAKNGQLNVTSEDAAILAQAAVEHSQAEPVNLTLGENLPPWSLDSAKMEQALVNLLINGRQASPEGATVEMAVRHQKDTLIFEIKDEGEGIAPGDEENIFEPFFTNRVKGTGLGLPLARRIVEDHGGSLTAGNDPHGGAVFTILLPKSLKGLTQ